ncbi:unnamed protein product [Aspergillus oryzae RIB40]|uniref:DNA, SC009 n=1 Tax=Aspergillus oryzae (strain ATCC 42149 / RIB 40) TaxID=510516 RepID=Q2UTM7_ASPOR|nr:unnamed protein product [Aspergillus oryzae RIB40]BAE55088.1 unnamed protein product [Aspergillus oryzae RIB40]
MSMHSTLSSPVPTLHHRSLRDLLHAREAADAIESILDTDLAADDPSTSAAPLSHTSIVVRRNRDTDEILIESTNRAYHNAPDGVLRRWEDLTERDQIMWKQQLTDAGHWRQDEGEAILQVHSRYCQGWNRQKEGERRRKEKLPFESPGNDFDVTFRLRLHGSSAAN